MDDLESKEEIKEEVKKIKPKRKKEINKIKEINKEENVGEAIKSIEKDLTNIKKDNLINIKKKFINKSGESQGYHDENDNLRIAGPGEVIYSYNNPNINLFE